MFCNLTYMPKLCRWIFECFYGRYLYELALSQEVFCASHCMAFGGVGAVSDVFLRKPLHGSTMACAETAHPSIYFV